MNPTKEELDKAIEYYEDMLNQNVPLDMEERTALTILTRYRDGELVLERTRKAESNVSKLEAENKDLRDGIVEFLTWMKKTQRLSIEAITAIDQLLLKNEG